MNFTDVEGLKQAVLGKVHDTAQQMIMRQYSSDPFLNIGIASIKFAREYSVLFKDLIFNRKRYLNYVQPSSTNIIENMKQSNSLNSFTNEELGEILFKMQVFQLGLSVMDLNGMLPKDIDEETIIRILDSAGKDIITAALLRKEEKV